MTEDTSLNDSSNSPLTNTTYTRQSVHVALGKRLDEMFGGVFLSQNYWQNFTKDSKKHTPRTGDVLLLDHTAGGIMYSK